MQSTSVFLFIALPWLNPFSLGPTPHLASLWFSWVWVVFFFWGGVGAGGRKVGGQLVTTIAAAWLAAALISTMMGLLQYFGTAATFEPWVGSAGLGEAFANLRQRNHFATLTNLGLVALLLWVACRPSRDAVSTYAPQGRGLSGSWWVLFAVAAAVLLGIGNAASSSRTGLVQLVLLTVMVGLWTRGGDGLHSLAIRKVLIAAVLAYGVAIFVLPPLVGLDLHSAGVIGRLNSSDAGCSSRLTLWSNVLHLIAQKPWLGWGWGELDYAHFITLYPGPRFCEILDNAHNLPLHMAVELGIPFALLVCCAGLWLVLRAKPWGETNATRQMAWSVLAVIGLHSLLEYPLWYGPFQMSVGLSVWLLWSTPSALRSTRPTGDRIAVLERVTKNPTPLNRMVFASAAALWMVVLVYAGWDYWRISQIYLAPKSRAEAYRDNTLAKIRGSWLFKNQVDFAELSTMPLTPDNVLHTYTLAKNLLHFSPEARVVEKLIESATMLGRDDEAVFYLARYQAAFPENHARWARANAGQR